MSVLGPSRLLLGFAWLAAAAVPSVAVAPARSAGTSTTVAVLPFENLTAGAAEFSELEAMLRHHLEVRGVGVLPDGALREFMARHRVRYVGGVTKDLAAAFAAETGAGFVLVTDVVTVRGGDVPAIALSARLVSTPDAGVAWMDAVARTGEDRLGIFDSKVVTNPGVLFDLGTGDLAGSLEAFLASGTMPRESAPEKRFLPSKTFARGATPPPGGGPLRVAVLPFADRSGRRRAGTVVSTQVERFFVGRPGVELIEPGIVREALLQTRLIPLGGVSVVQADILKNVLGASWVVTGDVYEFEEAFGPFGAPRVEFSMRAFDTWGRTNSFVAHGHHTGSDRVFFFDHGRVRLAFDLAKRMAQGTVAKMLEGGARNGPAPGIPKVDARRAGLYSFSPVASNKGDP